MPTPDEIQQIQQLSAMDIDTLTKTKILIPQIIKFLDTSSILNSKSKKLIAELNRLLLSQLGSPIDDQGDPLQDTITELSALMDIVPVKMERVIEILRNFLGLIDTHISVISQQREVIAALQAENRQLAATVALYQLGQDEGDILEYNAEGIDAIFDDAAPAAASATSAAPAPAIDYAALILRYKASLIEANHAGVERFNLAAQEYEALSIKSLKLCATTEIARDKKTEMQRNLAERYQWSLWRPEQISAGINFFNIQCGQLKRMSQAKRSASSSAGSKAKRSRRPG